MLPTCNLHLLFGTRYHCISSRTRFSLGRCWSWWYRIASKMEASLLRETKCGRLWTGLGGKIRLTQDTRQAILGGRKKMLLLKSKKSLVSYFEWPSRGCLITLFKSVILLICHTCHIKKREGQRGRPDDWTDVRRMMFEVAGEGLEPENGAVQIGKVWKYPT